MDALTDEQLAALETVVRLEGDRPTVVYRRFRHSAVDRLWSNRGDVPMVVVDLDTFDPAGCCVTEIAPGDVGPTALSDWGERVATREEVYRATIYRRLRLDAPKR